MFQDESLKLLKELCLAHGAPSREEEVTDVFVKHLEPLGKITKDKMGGVLCTAKSSGSGPRVLVTGHMDEVGFAVQNITPDGFVQIVALGGWWTHNLLSQRLVIKTKSGKKILGVVASVPPHFLKPQQRNEVLAMDMLFVDVGAKDRVTAEEDLGISLGDPIVPDSGFETLNDPNLLLCKAFDNRVGMAVTIQTLKNLAKHSSINVTLLGAGTVQEEVGLRGAKAMAVHALPDVALVLEGPPADDTPGMNRAESQGRIGGGAQIRLLDPSALMNPRLVDHVVKVAQKEKIPYQLTVRKSGGTDAGSFHLAGEGIPSIVIGVPARYIHTHNSVIHKDDYFNVIRLIEAVVKSFDAKSVAALTA